MASDRRQTCREGAFAAGRVPRLYGLEMDRRIASMIEMNDCLEARTAD